MVGRHDRSVWSGRGLGACRRWSGTPVALSELRHRTELEKKYLEQLGRSQCADMYRMLSVVLLVGQTKFSEAKDAGGTQTTSISRDGADSDSFARAAQLLGVDEAKFSMVMNRNSTILRIILNEAGAL